MIPRLRGMGPCDSGLPYLVLIPERGRASRADESGTYGFMAVRGLREAHNIVKLQLRALFRQWA